MKVVLGIILTGLIVGIGIGLTGMGGALIMTPLLILLFGFSPTMAVGTDLIFASMTKLVGSIQHIWQRTVHLKLVLFLSIGSIPGGLLGVISLKAIDQWFDLNIEQFLGHVLGILFIVVSMIMVVSFARRKRNTSGKKRTEEKMTLAVTLGFIGGFLVGMTSVGSGSLFMALLLIMSSLPARHLVGTDIVHAFLLTSATGLLHASYGHVDWEFALLLIMGSVPGILIGSRLTLQIPDWAVRMLLISILLLTGIQLTF